MEALAGLALLFKGATLVSLFGGVLYGLLIGIIPGIGTGMALALLLPLTLTLDASTALAAIIGLMAVNTTSDTIPAVMFGVPGTAGAAATVIDGYPMSKQGRTKEALGAAYTASVIGGVFGAILLGISMPVVGTFIPRIGTPELLAVCIFGISFVSAVSGRSVLKGMSSALIGILLAFVGISVQTGESRWTFGTLYLWDGVPLIPLALGLFAIPAMIDFINRPMLAGGAAPGAEGDSLGRGVRTALRHWLLILRSSWIGTALGAVPGIGVTVIDWIAYGSAVRTSRDPEKFGQGDIRGVIAPEASNNAKDGGSLIPALSLGIPGGAGMALVLGAFLMHGITPGPDMLGAHLDLTYMLVWGLVLANIIGAGICLAFTPQLARLLDVPAKYLVPFILTMVMMGAFQGTQSLNDLWELVLIGAAAYFMKSIDWPRPPLILGFVLGDIIERYLFISVQVYDWHWLLRPGVIVLLLAAAFVLLRPLFGKVRRNAVSFEGHVGKATRATSIATAVFAAVLAAAVSAGLVIAFGWSRADRVGPITVGATALVFLLAIVVTSGAAAIRTPAAAGRPDFGSTSRGIVSLGLMTGYIVLAALIGMLPAVLAFVPAVFLTVHRRPGWGMIVLTVVTFAFAVGLFEWILALPWPRPIFPQLQNLIFSAVR